MNTELWIIVCIMTAAFFGVTGFMFGTWLAFRIEEHADAHLSR